MENKTSGFTLVELLVVISIISLLSSIVLSSLNATRDKGRVAKSLNFDANVKHAVGDQLLEELLFNGTTTDSSGVGYTVLPAGAGTSAYITDQQGGVNKALNLNNKYFVASINAGSELDSIIRNVNTYTISFWFRTSYVTNDQQLFVLQTTNVHTCDIRIQPDGRVKFYMYGGSPAPVPATGVFSSKNLADGKWHHIVASWNKTSAKMNLFVDGALDSSLTLTTSMGGEALASSLYVGSNDLGHNFDIDDVRVYNTVYY